MLQKYLWTSWFFREELVHLQLYYSRTLSQEVFKHMYLKHFKERRYCYGRTSANENVTKKKKKNRRHMSKLDVFLEQPPAVLSKNTFSTKHLQMTASDILEKDIGKFKKCQINKSAKKIHTLRKKAKHGTAGNKLKCLLL